MKINLIKANQDLGVHVDGANLGPEKISTYFKDQVTIHKVDKPDVVKEKEKKNLRKNLDSVNLFDEELYKLILRVKEKEEFPITIGGDHTVAIGSSLASIKKEKSLGIIWIDAHGDYNTFETTITGNMHGLPLAAVNGNCPDLTNFYDGDFYKHCNTVIVGGRSLDKKEITNLKRDGVKVFSTKDIKKYGVSKIMEEAFKIASKNTNGVHISYDLDVIDPLLAPGVSIPAKDGISLEEALAITDELIKNKEMIKSLDLVEYNPTLDINNMTLDIAVKILEKIIKNFS